MILNEINQKMAIYKDCTLGEIMLVGTVAFFSELIIFSAIAKILFGYAAIGVAFAMLAFFHTTKVLLSQLQKIKYGKPFGYYKHLLVKKIINIGLLTNLYLTREGKWSIRRMR
jgi:conjugative transfer region protein (TIGR03750 family)